MGWCHEQRYGDDISPSSAAAGEGGGEGDFEHRRLWTFEMSLTPTLFRRGGRGSMLRGRELFQAGRAEAADVVPLQPFERGWSELYAAAPAVFAAAFEGRACIAHTFSFARRWRFRQWFRSSHTGSCDSRYRSRIRGRRESRVRWRRVRRAMGATRCRTVGTSRGSPSGGLQGTSGNISAS